MQANEDRRVAISLPPAQRRSFHASQW